METPTIIILSLIIIWTVVSIVRDANRNKWYRRGYVEASLKYDKDSCYKSISYGDEADRKYYDDYGFKYD